MIIFQSPRSVGKAFILSAQKIINGYVDVYQDIYSGEWKVYLNRHSPTYVFDDLNVALQFARLIKKMNIKYDRG